MGVDCNRARQIPEHRIVLVVQHNWHLSRPLSSTNRKEHRYEAHSSFSIFSHDGNSCERTDCRSDAATVQAKALAGPRGSRRQTGYDPGRAVFTFSGPRRENRATARFKKLPPVWIYGFLNHTFLLYDQG